MKILLTGANGFTGIHFTEMARAYGHEVVPLLSNLIDRDALHRELLSISPEVVVHLAAISFVGHEDEHSFYAINVVGTTNLLSTLAQLPQVPHKVLLASSANVYGNCIELPISESQTPAPNNHYAMSKLAMEQMTRTYFDRLPIIITRPFNYTGPGQALSFIVPKLVDHFKRGAPSIPLGNLQVEREFNDVKMVCSSYLHLLKYGKINEIYNVCTGLSYTLQNLIDILERLTGHQIRIEVDPALVRANELHKLNGNPAKLNDLLKAFNVKLEKTDIESTLKRMLKKI